MKTQIAFNHQNYQCDLTKGMDISIPIEEGENHVAAWYVPPVEMEPVRMGDWIGSVEAGASVNFRNIYFNPHGHGTHTECCGHITKEVYAVNDVLKEYFYRATLITVDPVKMENGDLLVQAAQIAPYLQKEFSDAVLIRTLPNAPDKKSMNYSGTNPCYFDIEIVDLLNEYGVKHFLVDQPSVDREEDGGALAFHHAFWNVPEQPNFERTITELIYVPIEVADGTYILEIQLAAFHNDASPSRPVLYKIQ